MKIGSVFKGDYLKAADIGKGERLNLTISEVVMAELDDGEKAVVHFRSIDKGLVLNKTNANMITEIAGTDETDNWEGIAISLYSTKVDFQGKRVDALRVDYPDGNKPPVTDAHGRSANSKSATDTTNWKLVLNEKLKAHCESQKLDWNKEKIKLLMTFAGTDDFVGLTPAQAKTACANLDDPNFLPF